MPVIEDRNTFLEILSSKPVKNIASHGDADGVSAAYISALKFRKDKPLVYFPVEFSDPSDNKGNHADLVLDKVPIPEYIGCVIDHHPDHLPTSNYSLWHGTVPASLLALELFKDDIPPERWWKACPGIVGDGQPEKIPPYVWEQNPELLESVGTVVKYRGNTNVYKNPVWFLLSSPLNSACRVGKRNLAFSQLALAKTPFDLIFDEKLMDCKEQFNREVDRVRGENRSIDLGKIGVWIVDSAFSVNGTLAWELNNNDRKTALVINQHNGRGSIRGVLVDLLKEKMPMKWGIGGHSGFAGFTFPKIESESDVERDAIRKSQIIDFLDDLRKVI